jgi:hypothetical protein
MALPQRHSDDWHAHYDIENPTEVDAYVRRYPSLVLLLERAPEEIAAAFEEDVRLVLRHELDPEDAPPSAYLSVDILTARDDGDALVRFDRFDDWWLDAMPRDGAVVVFLPRSA